VSRGAPPRPGCCASGRRSKVSPGAMIGLGPHHQSARHDATPYRNDVPGKIGDKGDVAGAEVVRPKNLVKIQAR
jgi:hypothetical protein